MPGSIDLNSVIAMMNQAASISEREAGRDFSINYGKSTELQEIQTPNKGKEKLKKAEEPIKTLSSNMLPVDPEAQVLAMMGLDTERQNYAMQVFDIVNTRNS